MTGKSQFAPDRVAAYYCQSIIAVFGDLSRD